MRKKNKKKNEKGLFDSFFTRNTSKKLLALVKEFDEVNADCANRYYAEFKTSKGNIELFIASREKVAPKTRKVANKTNEEVTTSKEEQKDD